MRYSSPTLETHPNINVLSIWHRDYEGRTNPLFPLTVESTALLAALGPCFRPEDSPVHEKDVPVLLQEMLERRRTNIKVASAGYGADHPRQAYLVKYLENLRHRLGKALTRNCAKCDACPIRISCFKRGVDTWKQNEQYTLRLPSSETKTKTQSRRDCQISIYQ